MTELAILEQINEKLDTIIFLGQVVALGLSWLGGATMVAAWLYCRRDGIF